MTPPVFLQALFRDPSGLIEIRVIEDRKGGKLVERRWYSSVDALVADLPRLLDLAAKHGAAIFFGVLPRSAEGKGSAADVLPSGVVWIDIDFKDLVGGEAEARKRIRAFPIQPSIVVRSGHGLHAYWLLREPADPQELSNLSRRLARALGGDHAFDAARILRLPGTLNRKDPEHPILVEVESLQSDRTFNASEIAEALELVGAGADSASEPVDTPPGDDGEIHIGDKLDHRVVALFDRHPNLRDLSDGKGKVELGPDGETRDTSSSGYDFSLALRLCKKGIRDPSILATTISCRPDGAAKAKGRDYIVRTVRNALRRAVAFDKPSKDHEPVQPDFQVSNVRRFASVPAAYELSIDGIKLHLTSQDLLSAHQFSLRFLDSLGRVPRVPTKGEDWVMLVNSWLREAERVEMPAEASEEPALRADIDRILENLPLGEELSDLDHGKALRVGDGGTCFKLGSVLAALKSDRPEIRRNAVSRILRDLGYDARTVRVGEGTAWAWTRV